VKDEAPPIRSVDATEPNADTQAARPPAIVHLPLFRPGTRVQYNGQSYTVGHVIVSRSNLKVFLQELGHAVEADKVYLPPTRLVLQRQPCSLTSPV